MDYKKSKAPVNTVTRNVMDLLGPSGFDSPPVPSAAGKAFGFSGRSAG